MSASVIKAEKREKLGSSEARRIRNSGRIPAIIYSKDGNNINLILDGREFEKEYLKNTILSSIIELDFAGKKTKVIAHKVDLDPVTDRPVHVDFLNCDAATSVTAKPKIIFLNKDKSPGLKKGGVLHVVLRRVEVRCAAKTEIPHTVEIDVGATHLGTKIRASDIILPANVSLVKKDNFLVGSVIGRGKSEEEETKVAAGTTPAAEGAAATGAAAGKEKEAAGNKDKK